MKLSIDTDAQTLVHELDGRPRKINLYSDEAFALLSHQWLTVGWNQKYTYTFTWLGRPIIQLPEDLIRVQEVIYRLKPDAIIETGVAHGGSLIFYASLCKLIGNGHVIGVDLEIRPHNRQALEAHELSPLITLIEGGSTDSDVVAAVKSLVNHDESIMVLLDSAHDKPHVAAELEAYGPFVTPSSYIVATDGIMQYLDRVPRGRSEWASSNPSAAAKEFATRHPEFVIEQPAWPFNESDLTRNVTHWPSAWLRRR
jgi:cephalosporin hydroxylase